MERNVYAYVWGARRGVRCGAGRENRRRKEVSEYGKHLKTCYERVSCSLNTLTGYVSASEFSTVVIYSC